MDENTWGWSARHSWSTRKGKIREIWRKVKIPGHVEAVLAAAKSL